MIIVSQDKKQIINFEMTQDIEINSPGTWSQGFYSIDTYPNSIDAEKAHIRLGIYKTEKRAKEVLKQIKIAYANNEMIKIPKINIKEEITATELMRCICYEMPEE